MKRITVGTETTLVVYEDGSGRAAQNSGHVSFYSKEQGIEIANAILAALGEPVEKKPTTDDGGFLQWGFYTEADGETKYHDLSGVKPESVLHYAKNLSQCAVGIYKLAGYVSHQPEPVTRKAKWL